MDPEVQRLSLKMSLLAGIEREESEIEFEESTEKLSDFSKKELIEQAQQLLYNKRLATEKSENVTKALIEQLQRKGSTLRQLKLDEEKEAKEKYHQSLDRLNVVTKQKELVLKEIYEQNGKALEKKSQQFEENQRLKDGKRFFQHFFVKHLSSNFS